MISMKTIKQSTQAFLYLLTGSLILCAQGTFAQANPYNGIGGSAGFSGFSATLSSPSVSSFPTYVDIPVDHFTGIPDIGYALVSLPTKSASVAFNLSLKYHPNNISNQHKASDVGLGWSLFGGGSISKVVIGNPDERTDLTTIGPNTYAEINDQFYYNFMGYSGRFLIQMHPETDEFYLTNTGANNLKFEFTRLSAQSARMTSFRVVDGNGITYEFDQYDTAYLKEPFGPAHVRSNNAFHLTRIVDANGLELATLEYEEIFSEYGQGPNNEKTVSTKKLKKINANDMGSVEFDFTTSLLQRYTRNDITRINSLTLKDMAGNQKRKCFLSYYSESHQPKTNDLDLVRFLQKLEIAGTDQTKVEKYEFNYAHKPTNNLDIRHELDGYGFSVIQYLCDINNIFYYNNAIEPATDNGVLERVKLPTGGEIHFDFEPHKVSFIDYAANNVTFKVAGIIGQPNQDDDFNEEHLADQNIYSYDFKSISAPELALLEPLNKENYYLTSGMINVFDTSYGSNYPQSNYAFVLDEATELYVEFNGTPYPSPLAADPSELFIGFTINTLTGIVLGGSANYNTANPLECYNNKTGPISLAAGTYNFNIRSLGGGYGTYTFYTKKKVEQTKKWWYAGGLRIRQVDFFDASGQVEPSKQQVYRYADFDEPNSSSGQLLLEKVLAETLYQAKVFYKNVQVTNGTGNGYSRYYYYSPFDTYDPGSSSSDWNLFTVLEKGMLNRSEVYDNQNRLVSKSRYYYDVESVNPGTYIHFPHHQAFSNFRTTTDFIRKSYELTHTFLFDPDIAVKEKSVAIINRDNYQLKSKTNFDSKGLKTRVDYYYASDLPAEPLTGDLITKNMVEVPLKTETFYDGQKLSEQKKIIKNWGSQYLATELIQSAKGTAGLETRVKYNKLNTTNGNPLEAQQENGTLISYIWGYNHTQLVAKVENMGYDSIPSGLITAIHSAATESDMLTALTALRNHSALSGKAVTTCTYLPLVGIKTITDPKGYTTTYHYDNFNRLEKVTDMENNILSENQYRYRTQN